MAEGEPSLKAAGAMKAEAVPKHMAATRMFLSAAMVRLSACSYQRLKMQGSFSKACEPEVAPIHNF